MRKNVAKSVGHGPTRRQMFKGAGTVAAGMAVAGGLAACGKDAEDAGPQAVEKSKVPVGSGVVAGTYVVVQPTEGDFKAYTAVCPHQGCLVRDISETEIVCPCHSSVFSTADGSKIAGPATEGLRTAKLADEGESLTVGPLEE